jgi:hypothetical protein
MSKYTPSNTTNNYVIKMQTATCFDSYAAATQSIALAMYALFTIPGKIAAFTDNVTGHTELRTLC